MDSWPTLAAIPHPSQFKAEAELQGRPEPFICGIYVLWAAGRPVYIGQSSNLVARLQEHRKTKKFDAATWYPVPDYATRLQLETILIAAALPAYNRLLYLGISKGRLWEVRHRAPGPSEKKAAARKRLRPRSLREAPGSVVSLNPERLEKRS